MIIHRHLDGSEGFQYEVGDRVVVERTIHGGWFDVGPVASDQCRIHKISKTAPWRIANLEVWYSPEWGTASCYPWMLKPHADTLAAASVVTAE